MKLQKIFHSVVIKGTQPGIQFFNEDGVILYFWYGGGFPSASALARGSVPLRHLHVYCGDY